MDYQEQVQRMVEHLAQDNNPAKRPELVKALASGLVRILATIPDHDLMHQAIDGFCKALHIDACHLHSLLSAKTNEVNAETFLRDHFQPEKFHG
jgi:hypothetical protein